LVCERCELGVAAERITVALLFYATVIVRMRQSCDDAISFVSSQKKARQRKSFLKGLGLLFLREQGTEGTIIEEIIKVL
jgi:hypothetical protein